LMRFYIAFLRGDNAGMDRETTLAKGKPGAEDWTLQQAAMVAAYFGQLRRARELSRRVVDLAQRAGEKEKAATYESASATYEARLENPAEARLRATDALSLSNGRDAEYAAAFALARAGDVARAESLASDLDRRFPQDTSVRYHYL